MADLEGLKPPSSNKYTWYELHRSQKATKGKKGGGLAIGVLNDLEPSWISKGGDETEAITVEIWIDNFPVRLVCGYGPQENDCKDRKEGFWQYLDKEVQNAATGGAGFILQMDGNLWPGQQIVMGDINVQNKNGKLLENFLTRNTNLSVVNALPLCEGIFTRVKTTKYKTTKTILDFFVVCDKILPHVTKMHIDEKGEHALTKYNRGIVKTDHNMLSMELNLSFRLKKEHERFELFNLQNKVCQQKFKEFTSKTNTLSKCFESDEAIDAQFQRWQNRFTKAIHACFRKVRSTNKEKKMTKIDLLMKEKKDIIKKKNLNMCKS